MCLTSMTYSKLLAPASPGSSFSIPLSTTIQHSLCIQHSLQESNHTGSFVAFLQVWPPWLPLGCHGGAQTLLCPHFWSYLYTYHWIPCLLFQNVPCFCKFLHLWTCCFLDHQPFFTLCPRLPVLLFMKESPQPLQICGHVKMHSHMALP